MEYDPFSVVDGQILKALVLGFPVQVIGVGDRDAATAGREFSNADQAVGSLIRQRAQQHPIHDAEYGGVRTDPERQGQHGHDGESRGSPKHAQAVMNVLRQVLQPFPAPRNMTLFLQVCWVAESTSGCGPSVICPHARLQMFLFAHFEMQAHLRFEVRVKLTPMH